MQFKALPLFIKSLFLLSFFLPVTISAQDNIDREKIQKILDKSIDQKHIFGITLSVSKGNQISNFAAGSLNTSSSYFLASVTKMYTAAIIFQLADQGKIKLNDPIQKYLPESLMKDLHVYKEIDYSNSITIAHLVSNTSGLPDYFEQKNASGNSIKDHLIEKGDTSLTFGQMMTMTKKMSPRFAPGQKGKAFYSDGNFQLLGQVIESVTGKGLEQCYQEFIFNKLPLKSTYLYSNPTDQTPAPIYFKSNIISIPKMMTSFQPDGGLVATSEENMLFLKAFFSGQLFAKSHLTTKEEWNKIYSPFQYGKGAMRFKFPGVPELIGHAGASGSFAYYSPAKDVFITGTINQINKPQLTYRLITKVLASIK